MIKLVMAVLICHLFFWHAATPQFSCAFPQKLVALPAAWLFLTSFAARPQTSFCRLPQPKAFVDALTRASGRVGHLIVFASSLRKATCLFAHVVPQIFCG